MGARSEIAYEIIEMNELAMKHMSKDLIEIKLQDGCAYYDLVMYDYDSEYIFQSDFEADLLKELQKDKRVESVTIDSYSKEVILKLKKRRHFTTIKC